MLKVAAIAPVTMTRVYEVLKWSFDALACGRFPAADPWGKVFCEDYMPGRARNAGEPLAKRDDGQYYRGAFAEFRGDWKYLKEAFCWLEAYHKSDFSCQRRMARKLGLSTGMWYSNFSRNAEHRSTMIANQEFVNGYSQRSTLVQTPGVHITRIVFDLMHCMELGVLQSSYLHYSVCFLFAGVTGILACVLMTDTHLHTTGTDSGATAVGR